MNLHTRGIQFWLLMLEAFELLLKAYVQAPHPSIVFIFHAHVIYARIFYQVSSLDCLPLVVKCSTQSKLRSDAESEIKARSKNGWSNQKYNRIQDFILVKLIIYLSRRLRSGGQS